MDFGQVMRSDLVGLRFKPTLVHCSAKLSSILGTQRQMPAALPSTGSVGFGDLLSILERNRPFAVALLETCFEALATRLSHGPSDTTQGPLRHLSGCIQKHSNTYSKNQNIYITCVKHVLSKVHGLQSCNSTRDALVSACQS